MLFCKKKKKTKKTENNLGILCASLICLSCVSLHIALHWLILIQLRQSLLHLSVPDDMQAAHQSFLAITMRCWED